MLEESATYYAADRIDLELSDEEFAVLTRLQELAVDYVKRRLNAAPLSARVVEIAEGKLENLGYRLEHVAEQEQKSTFVEGDCVVFLAHRGNLMGVDSPKTRADYEFMHDPFTVGFILKMKQALDKVHEGYRHSWMLNDLPPVITPPDISA
jgi:hypothetical protein